MKPRGRPMHLRTLPHKGETPPGVPVITGGGTDETETVANWKVERVRPDIP